MQLFRGPLEADGIAYNYNHVNGPLAGKVCDPTCFIDNVSGFNDNAAVPNLEPWIMLSEVQFTAAVPEPSTWIMMVLGFVGLGYAGYRHTAKRAEAMA